MPPASSAAVAEADPTAGQVERRRSVDGIQHIRRRAPPQQQLDALGELAYAAQCSGEEPAQSSTAASSAVIAASPLSSIESIICSRLLGSLAHASSRSVIWRSMLSIRTIRNNGLYGASAEAACATSESPLWESAMRSFRLLPPRRGAYLPVGPCSHTRGWLAA